MLSAPGLFYICCILVLMLFFLKSIMGLSLAPYVQVGCQAAQNRVNIQNQTPSMRLNESFLFYSIFS